MAGPVQIVFDAWLQHQANPGYCRLTSSRRKLISARLREYSADDLCCLIQWVHEADEPGPRWLRGQNPQEQAYLSLEALLRVTKLPPRMEKAMAWRDAQARNDIEDQGVDLGAMGVFRGQGTQ